MSNALGKGDTHEAILNSFAQTYGADVLEQSSAAATKLLLALALVALILLTVVFVRKHNDASSLIRNASQRVGRDRFAEASLSGATESDK